MKEKKKDEKYKVITYRSRSGKASLSSDRLAMILLNPKKEAEYGTDNDSSFNGCN